MNLKWLMLVRVELLRLMVLILIVIKMVLVEMVKMLIALATLSKLGTVIIDFIVDYQRNV
jgi:hypothetical protein